MKPTRKTARNRRRKGPVRRPVIAALLVTGVIIAALLFFLERFFYRSPEKPVKKAGTEERQKIPLRVPHAPGAMDVYSSVVHPVPGSSAVRRRVKPGHGVVAIIIDDMGTSKHEADTLLAMGLPLTFSIIPGLASVREVAEAAHRKGGEVMVHIPMEPKGVRDKPFEKNGLLLEMGDDEIAARLRGYLESVPYAVGANNHMGSRFTEDRTKMRIVLGVLKERNMFFIDSKTTPASVGDKLAREMGLATAARNIFLDNDQSVSAITAQIENLAAMARKSGGAIGICHPHKTTIQALIAALPRLRSEGITFVHASEMVR